jgi:hypothetical protein
MIALQPDQLVWWETHRQRGVFVLYSFRAVACPDRGLHSLPSRSPQSGRLRRLGGAAFPRGGSKHVQYLPEVWALGRVQVGALHHQALQRRKEMEGEGCVACSAGRRHARSGPSMRTVPHQLSLPSPAKIPEKRTLNSGTQAAPLTAIATMMLRAWTERPSGMATGGSRMASGSRNHCSSHEGLGLERVRVRAQG